MTCSGKKVTIDGKEYLLVDPNSKAPSTKGVVLVRTDRSGVHVGELASRTGSEVTLHHGHRIWRWRGANTLHELSQCGADQDWTRISERVPVILLLDAIEIIPCSEAAAINLTNPRWGV